MANIGFDVDGVIYKFVKAYHEWLNNNKGMNLDLNVEAQRWDWFTDWESVEDFFKNLHNGVNSGEIYWTGELYEPTIRQNLLDLKAAGHKIHIVTARNFGDEGMGLAATKHFFHSNGLLFDTMTVSSNKACMLTDVFIEDNLRNYDDLEACGVRSYLVNRPYNVLNDNRRRVNSVDEFTQLILEEKWQ